MVYSFPEQEPTLKLETAILRTVLYGDVFDFPMTVDEIHHFLIHDEQVTLEQLRHLLSTSRYLRTHLCFSEKQITRADRPHLVLLRAERSAAAVELWPAAKKWGQRLARLPFVRMVGVTGALAMNNPSGPHDDLDYLLVTARGRVWLARAFAVLLVRWARLHGVEICPNYVVAEDRMHQPRQDLYIAHEVAQVIPLHGAATYLRLRADNTWTHSLLPNAQGLLHSAEEQPIGRFWKMAKHTLEFVLHGSLGNALERWEYQRKLRRFSADIRSSRSAAVLDADNVKGHFKDHGHPVLKKYQERLRLYGLDEDSIMRAAGD
jgi:hypothetical protein